MLIRRSNWQDSSSWNSLPLTPLSNGLRDAREHRIGAVEVRPLAPEAMRRGFTG